MKLMIDQKTVVATKGQTLRELISQLDLDGTCLSRKVLAAKIAGEVFNLNYIPVRESELSGERASMRRAMAASKGIVETLTYNDPAGRDVYARTAQFVLFLAIHRLWPHARAKMNCTVGKALYVEVLNAPEFSSITLKKEVENLIRLDIPLVRCYLPTMEAKKRFEEGNRGDTAELLDWRTEPNFSLYAYEDFADYYYGELAASTGYLQVWDILPAEGGFMFLFPDNRNPDMVAHYEDLPKFLRVSQEGERWCELMECENVADLNRFVRTGKIRELIRVNEALHEKRFSNVADMVCQREAKIVMLSGPSSSGKTTSANRLATQLRVHGKKPILMSLDDYYVDRDKIKPGPDGEIDFEHINTIDTVLFSEHLKSLLSGGTVELPTFDFLSGKRIFKGNQLSISEDTVIIVEGLHALNPVLLPENLDKKDVFKLYVSPLIPLNLDDHNRIPTSLLRLLRRTVRDFETRGSSVQKTMSMWNSVRRGEEQWIFPYQEQADIIFNSSTLYELAVLKKHIYPLLLAVEPEDPCYEQVRAVVKVLNYVLEADVDDEIPPTSIVREFIGGNAFYK